MFSRAQIFLMRAMACALCCALVLALSADLGLLRLRKAGAERVAEAAGRSAIEQLDRTRPVATQRVQLLESLRAALAAAGEEPSRWQLSLLVTGTSSPPALCAIVSTDQDVETRVLGFIAPESARLKAEAVIRAE